LASKHENATAVIRNEIDGDGVNISPEVKEKVSMRLGILVPRVLVPW
jgi:hypothetical protein